MSRFLDDIRGGQVGAPWYTPPEQAGDFRRQAGDVLRLIAPVGDSFKEELPVVVIDNVSDYYFAGTDQEQWRIDRDFPNIAPPWPAFWTEHRMPKVIRSRECGETDAARLAPNGRTGALWMAATPEGARLAEGEFPAETKWILAASLFIDFGARRDVAAEFMGTFFFLVDAAGALVGNPWGQVFCRERDKAQLSGLVTFFHPSLLAISFLHCKNVAVEEHAVNRPLAKKFRRRHGFDPAPHKTLVIEPLKATLKREGNADAVGLQKAMHICRGHFADYTEGRGLFGKLHGRFWMPMHVRGSKGEKPAAREVEVRV